jgi:hypothetical protein
LQKEYDELPEEDKKDGELSEEAKEISDKIEVLK